MRRLDLACGQTPRDGFEGVDIAAGAQHRIDLSHYPWPFADSSAAELRCAHYIEHIEMVMVDARGAVVRPGEPGYATAQDALLRFFDECYRVLAPGGAVTVICPASRSDRAFADPTHRRFIPQELFQYLSAEWRRANHVDHYNVACDFVVESLGWTMPREVHALPPEVQAERFARGWNAVHDWHVTLTSKKPA